jgi:hypothetical protein
MDTNPPTMNDLHLTSASRHLLLKLFLLRTGSQMFRRSSDNDKMPSATSNQLFDELQSIKDIQWANLITLDLALYDSPNGKQKLASLLPSALRTSGFFSVQNFGVSKEAIEQQIKLSQAFFDLPLEEKQPYHDAAAWARGDRVGYRPIGSELRK